MTRKIYNALMKSVGKSAKPALWLLVMAFGLLAASCGNDGSFRVNGSVKNFGTGNLRVVYYSRGAVQSVVAPAVDGKFSMTGYIDRGTVARVYTGKGLVLGRVVAKPGDVIDVEFDAADPTAMSVDGNDDSKEFAKFLKDNAAVIKAADAKGINEAVERYVRANHGKTVSGLLMSDYFVAPGNEAKALELIGLLDEKVVKATSLDGVGQMLMRPSMPLDSLRVGTMRLLGRGDTLENVAVTGKALTMLMFTDADSRSADSVAAALSVLGAGTDKGKLQIVDISCDTDTLQWHRSLEDISAPADSVKGRGKDKTAGVKRFWALAPYNIQGLEDVAISRVPWFVVADSTGMVLYNGSSVAKAREAAGK